VTFPSSLTVVTVVGDFRRYSSTAISGKVVFRQKVALFSPTDNAIVPMDTYEALFTNGTFTIVLPSTNDPEWNPKNWTYEVEVFIGGRSMLHGSMALPYTASPVDFADVFMPGSSASGDTFIFLSARGAPGGVAALGSDGYVPDSQLRFPVLVLDQNEPLPAGTRSNTLVYRKTA
jgi:hypothetical protein